MKKVLLVVLCIIISIFMLTACSSGNDKSYISSESDYSGNSSTQFVTTQDRLIVYTVDLSITVDNVSNESTKISNKVAELGGYVSTSRTNNSGYASYVFKVPTNKLNELLESIESDGELNSKSVTSEDITEKYVNAKNTLEALKDRLLIYKAMDTTGWTKSEIFDLDDRIVELGKEIDVYEKKVNDYKEEAYYSTLNITIYGKSTYVEPSFFSQLGDTFDGSITSIGTFFKGVLLVLTALVPYIGTVAIIFGVYCLIKLLICLRKKEKFTLFKNARLRRELKKRIKKERDKELEERVKRYRQENIQDK